MQVAGWESAFEGEVIFLAGGQLVKFHHLQPEQVRQIVRIARIGGDIVFVHKTGVERAHERAAVLDVKLEPVRFPRQQVQRGGEDQAITREVFGRTGEIHEDVAVVQRVVEELDVLAKLEMFVGLHGLLQDPVIVVAVEDADLGLDMRPFDGRRQEPQFLANVRHLLENPAFGAAAVREHRPMKLFGAKAGLPPAEEDDGIGSRTPVVGEHAENPGRTSELTSCQVTFPAFCSITQSRVASGCGLPVFLASGDVYLAGEFRRLGLEGGGAFDADEVNDLGSRSGRNDGPRAQIGGDRPVGSGGAQDVGLHFGELDDGVAAETAPIQTSAGLWAAGATIGMGNRSQESPPGPNGQAHHLVQALDVSYLASSTGASHAGYPR
jgi:hypothetical protein